MLRKKKSNSDDDLLKVSENHAVPTEKDESSGNWWKTEKIKDRSGQELPQAGPWPSTSSEELQKFKGTPLIGRLSWSSQYIFAVVGICLSSLALFLGLWSQRPQDPGINSFVESVSVAHFSALAGTSVEEVEVASLRQKSGSWGSLAQASWNDYELLLKNQLILAGFHQDWAQKSKSWTALLLANKERANAYGDFFKQSNLGGEVQWVDQQRRLDEIKEWLIQLKDNPVKMPTDLSKKIQNINQEFANFNSSGRNVEDDSVARAWQEMATLWSTIRPEISEWAKQEPVWNSAMANRLEWNQSYISLVKSMNGLEETIYTGISLSWWVWLALVGFLFFLMLLWLVGIKQARWQILHAKSLNEQYDAIIFELIQVIGLWASGNWMLRAKVSENPVGTLADSLNQMMEDLRRLFMGIKKSASEMSSTGLSASETTGVLVDSQRQHAISVESGAKDVLRFIHASRESIKKIQSANEFVESIQKISTGGHKDAEKVRMLMSGVANKVEEAKGRVERLNQFFKDVGELVETINELSEQVGIAGMQASLHASRAGESGKGFSVVAQTVQGLASQSTLCSRQIGSTVDAARTDLEGLLVSIKEANIQAFEGSELSIEVNEVLLDIEQQGSGLLNHMSQLVQMAREQEQLAGVLDEQAKKEMSQINETQKQAQQAADGVLKMVNSVHELERSVTRFKV